MSMALISMSISAAFLLLDRDPVMSAKKERIPQILLSENMTFSWADLKNSNIFPFSVRQLFFFHQRRRAGCPDFYKSWEECPF
jgi:hypothetical protein